MRGVLTRRGRTTLGGSTRPRARIRDSTPTRSSRLRAGTACRARLLAPGATRVAATPEDASPPPDERADLGAFFDDDDDADVPQEQEDEANFQPVEETRPTEPPLQDDSTAEDPDDEEEDENEDVRSIDRLGYERLIIEGADVEDPEQEMKSMDESIAALQESYLDGSAYDSAYEPPPMPMKKLEDLPYAPMPEISTELGALLTEAKREGEAAIVKENWGEVTVTGLQSHAGNVTPGDVYFARVTEDYDGVAQIPIAFENGAVAIFLETDVAFSAVGTKNGLDPDQSSNGVGQDTLASVVPNAWKEALEQRGIPIKDLSEMLPVIPVKQLGQFMSALGCVFYGYPSSRMKIFGVVGSHGKTSTAWIFRRILEMCGVCTGIICEIEYALMNDRLTAEGEFFIPTENDPAHFRMAATPYHHTPFVGRYAIDEAIPDPLQVQKVLAAMAFRDVQACVIECPLYAMANGRLGSVDFDVLIYTNLQAESSDTTETFRARKDISTDFFRGMNVPEGQRVIVNADDPHVQDFVNQSREVPVVTYSLKDPSADVRTESVIYSIWESELVITTPLGKMQIITPLIGKQHVYNILASVAAAVAVDIDLSTTVAGIESLDEIPGRYEVVDKGQDFSVVVDRANSAPRLTSLIQTLRACGTRRVFVVFGCSGHHSPEERAEMGSAAHNQADVVIITSNSPENEAPDRVIEDIVAGFPKELLKRTELWVNSPWQDPGRVPWWFEEWLFRAQREVSRHIIEDRSIAIRAAIGTAKKDDVVIVAGRGDQDFSWWLDKDNQPVKTWYEDRKEVRDALIKLPHLRKSQVVTNKLPWEEPVEVQDTRIQR